ncbi:MAG: transcription-repair coupling factor [Candidatus Carbobacillus altaicus]|nr:transcription-repair coupling factor [Candidatus Carbobacillus altaicus]
MLRALLPLLHENTDFNVLVQGIERGLTDQLVTGLAGSAKLLFFAALSHRIEEPVVIVTHNNYQAQKIAEEMEEWLDPSEIVYLPGEEIIGGEDHATLNEERTLRLKGLKRLLFDPPKLIVISYAALRMRYLPKEPYRGKHIKLSVGSEIEPERLVDMLLENGYERVDDLSYPGQVARRGEIIDIFPASGETPVRLALPFDEIESIRTLDLENLRSQASLTDIIISPAQERPLSAGERQKLAERLEALYEEAWPKVGDETRREKFTLHVKEMQTLLATHTMHPLFRRYTLTFQQTVSVLEYISRSPLVVLDEISRIQEVASQYEKQEAEYYLAERAEGRLLGELPSGFTYTELIEKAHLKRLYVSFFIRNIRGARLKHVINFTTRSGQTFHGQIETLRQELSRWQKQNMHVLFLSKSIDEAHHLSRTLADEGIELDVLPELTYPLPKRAIMTVSDLTQGFEWPATRLVLVTEEEIYYRRRKTRRKRTVTIENAERIRHYQDLRMGDYVVHVHHGIGRFMGIETLETLGTHKDYLRIQYAGTDQLYVPVEQIDLIQKYIGAEEKPPKLNKLGGSEWARTKQKVARAVRDIAEDLIKLYAKRASSPGFAFPPDTPLQKEFEALFPYEPTPDQLRAIEEIKRDMEAPRPMDRLLCGDVGYGKTEVAIRAAFKAVMGGKQVAFLVPTTILAQQHYETIKERIDAFPVQLDVLSRFKTRAEQQDILKRLARGEIDIIVGTHRLLSKDVTFHDLGLLIVDEEQRFGVAHKERIKELKANIDVLTLTATPIPRTLHMSLLGVRDLSLIETPPENRYPVQTYVVEYSPGLVKEAIERELARGGQVFFLYNYVQTIYRMAEELKSLLPEAQIAVAHGQMPERELEHVMLDFLSGEIDVLVSTSIIETGVDIPNVNTLIIYDADRLGLSQLYQLRGRVGRTNRLAYAYLTVQKGKILSEEAEKRLEAIREFTELGSGFKIAMRDLAIRGAGNLLGAEQHGFIAAVGFDLYNEMLKEAVQSLRSSDEAQVNAPHRTQVKLTIDAYIPDDYVSAPHQKIALYKRLAHMEHLGELDDLIDELHDRFGPSPAPVERLLLVTRVRLLGELLDVEKIWYAEGGIRLLFHPDRARHWHPMDFAPLQATFGRSFGIIAGERLGLILRVQETDLLKGLNMLIQALSLLLEESKQKGVISHVQ